MTYTNSRDNKQTTEALLNGLTELFKGLSDPTRLNVLQLLALNPEHQLCVGGDCRTTWGDATSRVAASESLAIPETGESQPRWSARIHYSIDQDMLATY